MRILMFGNSFTYYNDMPAMLSEILQAEVKAVTRGGAKLSEFRDPEREIGKEAEDVLRSGHWDYVILQDQSSRPVRFRDSFLRDVHILCRKIRSVGACPLLFATWPYRPGADQYKKTRLDFESLGVGLADAYRTAGEKEGLPVADAGRRFIKLWESGDPKGIEGLYAPDGSHPGMAGSRIAAESIADAIRKDMEKKAAQAEEAAERGPSGDQIPEAEREYFEYPKPTSVTVKDTDIRIRILHMYQVLRKHSDAEHPLTTNQIRALMEKEHGISMHRTTVPGDIEVLKAAGFNVVGRRARQNKYYLAEGDFELAELKILIDAVESSRFITEKKSGELIEKLSSLTSEQNARKLRRHIFTTGRVRSLNEKCWYIIDAFNEAINEGRRVSFQYTDIDGRKRVVLRNHGRPYIISPYTLLWNGDFYYLLGFDHNKGEMRTYRVDRIADQPQILKEAADPVPEDFDLGRYTREVFRMFDNEQLQEVDLLCSYEVMKGVVDQFGMDIKIKRAGTGWFGLRVTVCTSATFYAWVFQWAGRIRIMGPEKARQEYRQMALKALEEGTASGQTGEEENGQAGRTEGSH